MSTKTKNVSLIEKKIEKTIKRIDALAKMTRGKMRVKKLLRAIYNVNKHGLIRFTLSDGGLITAVSLSVSADLNHVPDKIVAHLREKHAGQLAYPRGQSGKVVFTAAFVPEIKMQTTKKAA